MGGAAGIWWVDARDAAQHPTTDRTTAPQRSIWPKMSKCGCWETLSRFKQLIINRIKKKKKKAKTNQLPFHLILYMFSPLNILGSVTKISTTPPPPFQTPVLSSHFYGARLFIFTPMASALHWLGVVWYAALSRPQLQLSLTPFHVTSPCRLIFLIYSDVPYCPKTSTGFLLAAKSSLNSLVGHFGSLRSS